LLSPLTYGAVFQIFEQDAEETGIAYSGMATSQDATAAFYNPAGMVFMTNPETSFGATYASVKMAFSGTLNTPGDPTATPPTPPGSLVIPSFTGNTRNVLGNFHIAVPFNRIAFGFSATAPFAFETNYDNTITQAYATRTYLQALNFNPSVAVKLTDKLSVGVGVNAQQLRTVYDASAGFILFTIPVEYNLMGWDYTWNAGAMYQIFSNTSIGVSYRPHLAQEVNGNLRVGALANLGSNGGASFQVNSVDASTVMHLPATTSFGIRSDLTKNLALMSNAVFTQWSTFENVTLRSAEVADLLGNVSLPTVLVTQFDFRNSWFFSLGAEYNAFKDWTFTGGIGWDQTPAQDKFREFRIPDEDRYQLGVGLIYQANPNLSINLAYQHFFLPERAKIDHVPVLASPLSGSFIGAVNNFFYKGSFDSSADVFSAQFNWAFI
jgi:long-chain fatty acid transport protein